MYKLPEAGIAKAWSDMKRFRSAYLSTSIGYSKKSHLRSVLQKLPYRVILKKEIEL